MSRRFLLGTLWVVLVAARPALAQEPPPLEPPALEAPGTQAIAPKPAVSAAVPVPAAPSVSGAGKPAATTVPAFVPATTQPRPTPANQTRPLLVIPGVTAPAKPAATIPRPRPFSNALDGGSPTPAPLDRQSSSSARPTVVESIPLSLEPLDDEPAASSRKPVDRGPGSVRPRIDQRPTLESLDDDKPPIAPLPADDATSRTPPRRPPTIFERILGTARPPEPTRSERRPTESNGPPKPGTPADAATDAAARKRIQREIDDTLGDRLKSLEVRVNGHNVLIVARASRFWQKRSVKRTLETLPGLAGYRARVDILD